MRLLRTMLGNRGIARLEAGAATASLGTWTFAIALALYAYYEDGAGGVALAVAVRMLPSALLAPLVSRAVDTYPRRTVLVASALSAFVLLEAIALAAAEDIPFVLLLGLAAGFEVAASGGRAARAALLVELARTPAELAASAVGRFVDYSGFLAGALVAAVLLAVGNTHTLFAASGIAYLAVAALAWRVPTLLGARARPSTPGVPNPWIRMRASLFGASVLVQSMLELLLVVTAFDLLEMDDSGVGWLRAAFALGGLAGGAAALTVLRRGRLALGLAAGLVLAGVPLALVSAWPETAPALLFLALLGGGYAVTESALLLLTQRLAPAGAAARIAGLDLRLYPVTRAAGTGLAALLVVQLGDKGALVVSALLLPALAVLSLRSLSRTERGIAIPEGAFRLLRRVPAFAPLPAATVENLALCAVPVRFDEGSAIDPCGFHAIGSGSVELQSDGHPPAMLGTGDCFGDAALLDDAPVGSTAVALTPVAALTIARPDFMSRVAGPVWVPASRGQPLANAQPRPQEVAP